MCGFIKLQRGKETEELMKYPPAFMLLSQIAYRARRTDEFNINNLKIGEALIGDYKKIGLTLQTYRTAKSKLTKRGFITTQITNKGTVAKIINKLVYDINENTNNKQDNKSATSQQQTDNKQITTNKNDKKEKKEKNDKNIKENLSEEQKEKLYLDYGALVIDDYIKRVEQHKAKGKKVNDFNLTIRNRLNKDGKQKLNTKFNNDFLKAWKIYPHTHKSNKDETQKLYKKNMDDDNDLFIIGIKIISRQVEAGLKEIKYIPSFQKYLENYTPFNKIVAEQEVREIVLKIMDLPRETQKQIKTKQEKIDKLEKDFGSKKIRKYRNERKKKNSKGIELCLS